MPPTPRHLDIQRTQGLTITWADGRIVHYPVLYLRRMSPSADARQTRESLESGKNLTVLQPGPSPQTLSITSAEPVGRYALRIRFSDGHDTGIYSWSYLHEIEPLTEH